MELFIIQPSTILTSDSSRRFLPTREFSLNNKVLESIDEALARSLAFKMELLL